MFGEDYILGEAPITIDGKGRIILPKFTYIEVDDELVFSKIEVDSCFTIFSKSQIFKKLSTLKSKQENAKTHEEYDLLQRQIDKIQNCCFGISKADKQHRILLPNSLRESLVSENKLYINGGLALQIPCVHAYKDKTLINKKGK